MVRSASRSTSSFLFLPMSVAGRAQGGAALAGWLGRSLFEMLCVRCEITGWAEALLRSATRKRKILPLPSVRSAGEKGPGGTTVQWDCGWCCFACGSSFSC